MKKSLVRNEVSGDGFGCAKRCDSLSVLRSSSMVLG